MDKRTCAFCGKEFMPRDDRQKFCSAECRIKFFNEKITAKKKVWLEKQTRKCDFCGKEYTPIRGNQRYCTNECRIEADRQAKKEANKITATKKCEICEKEFLPTKSRQKYCSPDCVKEAHKANQRVFAERHKVQKKCRICGAILTGRQISCCSKECLKESERRRRAEQKQNEVIPMPKPRRKPKLSISEICRLALEEHLTYGQYVQKYGV